MDGEQGFEIGVVTESACADIGESIVLENRGRIAEVRGYAVGRDGRLCYCIDRGMPFPDLDGAWDTALIPLDEVEHKAYLVPIGGEGA